MVVRDRLAHRVTDYIDSMHSGLSSAVPRLLSIALLLLSISLLPIGLLSPTLIGRVLLQRLRPCLLLRWVRLSRTTIVFISTQAPHVKQEKVCPLFREDPVAVAI